MKKIPILICLLLLVSCFPIVLGVNTVTNTRTSLTYSTIQDAVDAALTGDTLSVGAGTYEENIVVDVSVSIIGVDMETVIVNGSGSGTVFDVTVHDVTFKRLTIQNGETGIYLDNADDFTMSRCQLINDTGGDGGIYFDTTSNAIIYENNFTFSDIALYNDDDCENNWIYHNNFFNSTGIDDPPTDVSTNRWNDTYPSGGNYWSDDVTFEDSFSGPDQDIPGSDGIVDTDYTCGRAGNDYYPFVDPIVFTNMPPTVSTPSPANGATEVSISQATVSIYIGDPSGTFDWTIEGNYVTASGATGAHNGTKTANIITPLEYYTDVIWYVNATNGLASAHAVYSFKSEIFEEYTTNYVSPSYGPSDPQYRKNHWDDLQEAIDTVADGGTVYLYSGTYNVGQGKPDNILIEKPVSLVGQNRETTIIRGEPEHSGVVDHTFSVGVTGVGVDGVSFTNLTIENEWDGVFESSCISFREATNCMITDCIIKGASDGWNGISSDTGTQYITISNSKIINFTQQAGILTLGKDWLVISNNFSECFFGMSIQQPAERITVMENSFSENWKGLWVFRADETLIEENDFFHSHYEAIEIGLATTNTMIFHNNFYNNAWNNLPPHTQAKDNTISTLWNDTYPSGGNYWSDFDEASEGAYDRYHGPDQSADGPDGIVDYHSPNPYNMSGTGNGQDWYPLMFPYVMQHVQGADFSWSPKYPEPKNRIDFTETANIHGKVTKWTWTFGDGKTYQSTKVKTATHTYTKEGFYLVTLSIMDTHGTTYASSKKIYVGNGPHLFPPMPPKYAKGFTVPEMYMLLRAMDLPQSNAKVTVMVIDSGYISQKYNGVDLSKIQSLSATSFTNGGDENGHGCIDGDSYIFTKSGLIKIRDYYENINIEAIDTNAGSTKYIDTKTISLAEDGMAVKDDIYATHKVKVDDAIKITTLWNKTLLLTPWHPTPVIVDNQIVWKRADKITTDDYVVFLMNPLDFGEYQTITMLKRDKPGPSELIPKNMTITEDLAWLIGFTIGDGTVHSDRNCVLLFDEKLETLEKAKQISIENGFSVGKGIYKGHSQNGNTIAIYGLDKFFEALGYNNTSKNIPEVIFKSPVSVRASFVAGLFDAEGYVWESNGIRQRYNLGEIRVITSVNERLCKQLITILDSLGLPSSYKILMKNGYSNNPNNNTVYAVVMRQKWNLNNFYDRICPYVVTFKKDVIKRNIDSNRITSRDVVFLKDYVGLKVKKTENMKVDTYFYDLSTKKYNNYYASGFIVHNTWVNYAVAYLLQKKLPQSEQISYRVFDAEGGSTTDTFMSAFKKAKEIHPDIVSISAGVIGGSTDDPFSKACEELRQEGIIVIVAAGNFGPAASSIASPGVSDSVIAVAASDPQWVDNSNPTLREHKILDLSDDTICSWSSRGPVAGVAVKPDCTSPGESIIGPWLKGEKVVSGTSMATPLISGGAAVIVANNKGLIDWVKNLYFWDKSVIPDAFEDAIKASCYQKGSANDWGAGIVQFDKINGNFQMGLVSHLIIWFAFPLILLLIIIILLYYYYRKTTKSKSYKKYKKAPTKIPKWAKKYRG